MRTLARLLFIGTLLGTGAVVTLSQPALACFDGECSSRAQCFGAGCGGSPPW